MSGARNTRPGKGALEDSAPFQFPQHRFAKIIFRLAQASPENGMDMQVEARIEVRALAEEAVQSGHIGPDLAQRDLNIALQETDSFRRAVAALSGVPEVREHYGTEAARDLALRFAHKFCSGLKSPVFDDVAFTQMWDAFLEEILYPEWTYVGVAHLQNFETDFRRLDLGDGISIEWNQDEIQLLMGWTDAEDKLFQQQERREIMPSLYAMVVRDRVKKSSLNARQIAWDGLWKKANRALRSMRLLKPGDVRIGRLWVAQPAAVSVLSSGMQWVGISMLRPGASYYLAGSDQPRVAETYKLLSQWEQLQESLSKKKREKLPNFEFALRAFDSIYDRQFHRTDDQVVDAVTALEALFMIKGEQSFRTALRSSGLLAGNDDERCKFFQEVRDYYDTRSAIVHGLHRTAKHDKIIQDNRGLRRIVQSLLLGFLKLMSQGMTERDIELWSELEAIVLHSAKREELRRRMGLT